MTGLNLFSRASNGDLIIASYTGSHSYCWVWSVALSRQRRRLHIAPRSERHNQWHHYIPLLVRTLIISRQDHHLDPRHRRRS